MQSDIFASRNALENQWPQPFINNINETLRNYLCYNLDINIIEIIHTDIETLVERYKCFGLLKDVTITKEFKDSKLTFSLTAPHKNPFILKLQ